MALKCDVLVVGSGPAGSSAARAAAKSGTKTVLIDNKKEIGVPVQCAEAIGKYLFPFLPFKIPKEQLIWKTEGMIFYADDINIERRGRVWRSYAVNRNDFDAWLANSAVKEGAALLTSAELVDMEIKNEYEVKRAIIKTPEGERVIEPRVVIAADGVDSTVLKLLGFKINKKGNIGEVLGYELKNLSLYNPNFEHLFIGDFAPGGYAYIFPKSKHVANVGVAAIFPEKSLEEYYKEFLEIPEVKRQVMGGITVEEKSGKVPIRYSTDMWVYGNVLLTGDVASQNLKPFAEGILPAVICGDIAGKTASDYLKGKISLNTYSNRVRARLGNFLKMSDKITDIAYELAESETKEGELLRLCLLADIISLKQISRLSETNRDEIKEKINDWQCSIIRQFITTTMENLNLFQAKFMQKIK
ncbi:digeranylgeranylglycerophospholipid reductase [Methanophagales archaeon]|nr:digeranylgeranylglycerophospholipid reductase [Methanophagales archaeon]